MKHKADRLKVFFSGFGLLLIYELIEEMLESLIAFGITTLVAKTISFLLIVFATQTIKISIKSLIRLLKPFVKTVTFKEGNDKMKIVKSIFANIKANWKNYIGIMATIVTLALVFLQDMMDFGIGIQVAGYNIVPFIAIILSTILSILGVCVDGVHLPKVWQVITAAKIEIKKQAIEQKKGTNVTSSDKNDIDEYIKSLELK